MPVKHTAEEGDSVIKLADQHGHFAATIWNDAANAELKKKRKDMNVLLPGDVVVIPDKRVKEVKKPTGEKHVFRRKGIPAIYRLQLFDVEEPRANQTYKLTVDGQLYEGTTNENGILEEFVPATSQQGELIVGPDEFRLLIDFGHLDPITEIIGIQKRLNNLGYFCEEDGTLNESTQDALADFQYRFGMEDTGEPDEATVRKLEEVHDRPNEFPQDDAT